MELAQQASDVLGEILRLEMDWRSWESSELFHGLPADIQAMVSSLAITRLADCLTLLKGVAGHELRRNGLEVE